MQDLFEENREEMMEPLHFEYENEELSESLNTTLANTMYEQENIEIDMAISTLERILKK